MPYGLQKVPETEVRGNMDIAGGAASSAASGALMGSKFGPWGAVIGGVAGGIYGGITGSAAQEEEEKRLRAEQSYNSFVDLMGERGVKKDSYSYAQARNGMRAEYITDAEIEGDGSGDSDGIGEVHVDKHYNIKTVANGAPKHEQGGVDLPDRGKKSLVKGDVIFPWQNDKNKYEKGLNMIKRYKLNNDMKAKKWLDDEASKLPTDADYSKKFRDGFVYVNNPNNKNDPYSYRYKEGDKNSLEVKKGDWTDWRGGEKAWGQDYTGKPGVKTSLDQTWENLGLGNTTDTGNINVPPPTATADTRDYSKTPDINLEPLDTKSTELPEMGGIKPFLDLDSDVKEPSNNLLGDLDTQNTESGTNTDDYSVIKDRTNPLKYSNILHNFIKGMDTDEKSVRRRYTPEEAEYKDMSEAERRSLAEQRNFQALSLRGKGMSAGQQQSYLGQIGAGYAKGAEDISSREAKRRDATEQYNVSTRNRADEINVNMANQYDLQDAQARAARQKYTDTGFQELAQIADIDEQRSYMKSRDKRAMDMEQKKLGLVGSDHFRYINGKMTYIGEGDNTVSQSLAEDQYNEGDVVKASNGKYMIKKNNKWEEYNGSK